MSTFYDIKKALIKFFANIRIYRGGIILFGDSSYGVKGPDAREILNVIKPGDVLLRRYDNYLGTFFIKGHYSHSAMYLGDDIVIHMLGKGVSKGDILTFLRCDSVCVLRHPHKEKIIEAIKKAEDVWNKKIQYDFDFDLKDNGRMFCTEFIDYCFGGIFYPSNQNVILPDDFLNSIFSKVLSIKGKF